MDTLTAAARWFVVGDLHLDAVADEHSHRFAGWLDALVREHAAAPVGLLLLGDVLELLEHPGEGPAAGAARRAVRRLRSVLHAHPDVVRGLRDLTTCGAQVVLVPGNHDADLLRPEVAAVLTAAVGDGLRLEPWLFHVPGLLLAEHGNQHHEINRFPRPLDPVGPDGGMFAPCAPRLVAVRRARGLPARLAATADAARGLVASTAAVPADPGYRALLSARARATGLPDALLTDLHAASRSGVLGAVARPLLRAARGREPHAYLRRGVRRTAALLDRYGVDAPYLLHGHVHAVADEPVGTEPVGTERRYLNTGTWSRLVRPGGPPQPAFPYLEIRAGRPPSAAVRSWPDDGLAAAGTSRPTSVELSA